MVDVRRVPLLERHHLVGRHRPGEQRRLSFDGIDRGQAIEAFVIVRAPAARIVPPIRLVHEIGREGRGRPVVSIGARFRVDEETIQQAEAERQRPMIRGDVLRRSSRGARGLSGAEDRQVRVAIGPRTVARLLQIAEDLIVGAILLDDIDDVLDRIGAGEEGRFHLSDQSVVAQYLLREPVQPPFVRDVDQTQIAADQRAAVLAPLPARRRKPLVGGVGGAARIVDEHRGVLDPGPLSIADDQQRPDGGDRRGILSRRDEPGQPGFPPTGAREVDDGDRVAVGVRDEERAPVGAQGQALRAAPGTGRLGQSHADALDLLVQAGVDHRDGVGVRVHHVQALPRHVEGHRRGMSIHHDAPDRTVRMARIDHGQGGVVPAGDVDLGDLAISRGQDRHAVGIDGPQRIVAPQVDAHQVSRTVQAGDDPERVPQVVGDEEGFAVRAEGQPGRIDGREVVVVTRRRGLCGEPAHVDELRLDPSVRPGRRGRDRRVAAGGEPECPDLVLDAP